MKYYIKLTQLFLLCLMGGNLLAQNTIQRKLVVTPTLKTFSKQDYNAENQNWAISSSESGAVYFANSLGLLKFDGENWSQYKTDNILRSVFCSGDTIYVGGSGIMGYFIESENLTKFHSLSNIQTDIWQIYQFNNNIVFQSFNSFYYLDENKHISIERINKGNTTYSYVIDNNIYYQITYDKLVSFKPNASIRELTEPDALKNYMIKYINALDNNTLLLGSLNNGLFTLKQGILKPINNTLNELLKEYKINRITPLDDDYFAFGTMNGGLIVAQLSGHIKYILNTDNGLPNNRIHSIYKNDNNLWIGTDNGITLLDLNNPIRYLENKRKGPGVNYDIVAYDGFYYLCTNQGIFKSKILTNKPHEYTISQIEGTEGHGWNLAVIDNKLFVGHNSGTFLIENNTLKRLSHVSGGYSFLQSKKDSNIIYQTSYYGLAVYEKKNGEWIYSYNMDNIDAPTRDVLELEDGNLMVTTLYKEAFKVYANNKRKYAELKDISKLAAFSNSKWIRAFSIDNRVLLASNDTSFFYNNDKLEPAPKELQQINYISEAINEHHFIIKNNRIQLFNKNTKEFVDVPYKLNKIEQNLIFKYEKIRLIKENTTAFCLSNAIAFADIDDLIKKPTQNNRIQITSIEYSNDRTGETIQLQDEYSLPYEYNTAKFSFTDFNYLSESEYEFFLEGYHQEWRSTINRNWVKFQNLREGDYVFHVKEKNKAQSTSYAFTIKPPYYRSGWAYLLYVLFIISLSLSIRFFYNYRLRKKYLIRLVKERKKQNELRLLSSKKQLDEEVKVLQSEVTNKTDKLANLLLQNTKKKEVIDSIKDELQDIKKEQRYVNARHIDKLSRMIKNNFDETKDWLVFEASFSETHQNFFKKLKLKHPKLTDEDLKLCAYLKVNLSSKELAPIFKITTRSVDLKKYRLKKKLDLGKTDNLKQYIKDFDG